jgi:large subunit ribosomal protein L29
MKSSEIREFTDKEIEERIDGEQTRLTQLRLNHAVSPLDNPMKIKEARKNIARLKTELNHRLRDAVDQDKDQ